MEHRRPFGHRTARTATLGVTLALASGWALVGTAVQGTARPGQPAAAVVPQAPGTGATARADEGGLAPAHLANLRWRNIGPAVTGGRIVEFAVADHDPDIIYAATASGGAWKTTNGGTTWQPIFQNECTISIGAIAVAPTNPNLVWIGTGEANSVRSSSWGDGTYKSEDGGRSWKHAGLEKSQHVGRILVHPTDPRTVYVAALGALWGANEERGLYKTTDGGATWTRVLGISKYTGVVDVAMDPRDPDVLYAAAFQRERRYYSFLGGGPEGGIFKSTDGGRTWAKLTGGLPTRAVGRIGIAVCPSAPDTVYAAIVGPDGGIFRSDDRGASWERRTNRISTHWYYGQIYCHPRNTERVYVPMTRFYVSDDGGRTFRDDFARANVHGDHHTMWINPRDPEHLVLGKDGGIYISRDVGAHWEFMDHLSITQFYTVAVDLQEPYYFVYGGTQDNSSYGGPSGTRNVDGIVNHDWYMTVGGDGFYSQIDPTDPTIVYAESQYGNLVRFDTRTGERRAIQPEPPAGKKYRWNWSAPLVISAHDPKTLYFGANVLFRSADRGDSWEIVSPDLTRQIDEYTLSLQDKVQSPDAIDLHASTADYGNITSIAESVRRRGLLAVGTDDGLVQVTRDDGKTWTRIGRIPGVPEQARVSRVVLSRFADETIYVTFDAHQDNDFRPYVLKSTDLGRSWTSLANTLPESGSVHVLAEHHRNPQLLFVGTEFGVFVSVDGGGRLIQLKNNLPTVAVHDLVVHPRENDLVLGTHGRGFWILDDIAALEGLTPGILAENARLFPVRRAWQLHRFNRGRNSQGQQRFAAPNPPDGAIVSYFARAGTSVDIDVLDGAGKVVRRLPAEEPRTTGVHRVVWDLRYGSPFDGDRRDEDEGSFPRGRGPFVMPGEYEVRLHTDGAAQRQKVRVLPDPFVEITEPDRRTWHDTLLALSAMVQTARAAQRTLEQVEAQMKTIGEALTRRSDAAAAVDASRKAIAGEVVALGLVLRGEPPKGIALTPGPPGLVQHVAQVYAAVEGSTGKPTADQLRVTRENQAALVDVVSRLNRLTGDALPALHKALDVAGVEWTMGRPLSLPRIAVPSGQ